MKHVNTLIFCTDIVATFLPVPHFCSPMIKKSGNVCLSPVEGFTKKGWPNSSVVTFLSKAKGLTVSLLKNNICFALYVHRLGIKRKDIILEPNALSIGSKNECHTRDSLSSQESCNSGSKVYQSCLTNNRELSKMI